MSSKANLTAWERWELASFDGMGAPSHKATIIPPANAVEAPPPEEVEAVHLPTAEEVEAMLAEVRQQGYQAGHAEGFLAGQNEGLAATQVQTDLLAKAVVNLDTAISNFDEQVSQEILQLSLAIARQVLLVSVSRQPDSLPAVISEALALLPHQHANIYLHPEDAALVRNQQGTQLTHAGHRIHDDPTLTRGDCVLEAGNSRVDATLEARWRKVVAALGSDLPLQDPVQDQRIEPDHSADDAASDAAETDEAP